MDLPKTARQLVLGAGMTMLSLFGYTPQASAQQPNTAKENITQPHNASEQAVEYLVQMMVLQEAIKSDTALTIEQKQIYQQELFDLGEEIDNLNLTTLQQANATKKAGAQYNELSQEEKQKLLEDIGATITAEKLLKQYQPAPPPPQAREEDDIYTTTSDEVPSKEPKPKKPKGKKLKDGKRYDFGSGSLAKKFSFYLEEGANVTIDNALMDIQKIVAPPGTQHVGYRQGSSDGNFTIYFFDANGGLTGSVRLNNAITNYQFAEEIRRQRKVTDKGSAISVIIGNAAELARGNKTAEEAGIDAAEGALKHWFGNNVTEKLKEARKQAVPATSQDIMSWQTRDNKLLEAKPIQEVRKLIDKSLGAVHSAIESVKNTLTVKISPETLASLCPAAPYSGLTQLNSNNQNKSQGRSV